MLFHQHIIHALMWTNLMPWQDFRNKLFIISSDPAKIGIDVDKG